MRQRQIVKLGLGGLGAFFAVVAAVAWPVGADTTEIPEQITIVIPFADGGAVAEFAEVAAGGMSARLDIPVVLKNIPGQGGLVGTEVVANAEPDGATLLMAASSSIVLAAMFRDMDLNLVEDFDAIGQAGPLNFAVVVPSDSPYETANELVEAIGAQPGMLRWAHAGRGSSSYVAGRIMLDNLGLIAGDLPYGGGGIIREAVTGEHVDFAVLGIQQMHYGTTELRALAVTGQERSNLFPEFPTLQELGLGVGLPSSPVALYAPRHTTPDVLMMLRKAFEESMRAPAVEKALLGHGLEVRFATPQDVDADMRELMEVAVPVIEAMQKEP